MFIILILHRTRISKGWEENWGQALPKENSPVVDGEWIETCSIYFMSGGHESHFRATESSLEDYWSKKVNGGQRQLKFKVGSSGSPWEFWAVHEAWKVVEWALRPHGLPAGFPRREDYSERQETVLGELRDYGWYESQ